MSKKSLLTLIYLSLLCSCATEKPEIRTISELTPDGNYLIKWETFPSIEGKVRIYPSPSPDSFDLNMPVVEEKSISSGYATLPPLENAVRTYFELVFNKDFSVITTERVVPMEKIFNFRDFGGYNNKDGSQIKWGRLYRSSSLERMNDHDLATFKDLGIKTVIDLRSEQEFKEKAPRYKAENIYNIPLKGGPYNVYFDRILSEETQRKDVMDHLQKVFYSFSEKNSDNLKQIFDILLEEKNYPLVIACSLGKDRTATVVATILASLDVNENTIINDYLLSNDLIDFHSQARNASQFSPKVQETLTALFSAHRETIIYTMEKLKEKHGSINHYLENELQLTKEKRDKLKELLLYP